MTAASAANKLNARLAYRSDWTQTVVTLGPFQMGTLGTGNEGFDVPLREIMIIVCRSCWVRRFESWFKSGIIAVRNVAQTAEKRPA